MLNSAIQFSSADEAREMLDKHFPGCRDHHYNEYNNQPNELYNAKCAQILSIVTNTFINFNKAIDEHISNLDIYCALNNQPHQTPIKIDIVDQYDAIRLVQFYKNAEDILFRATNKFTDEYRCRIVLAAIRVAVYLGNAAAHDHLTDLFNQKNLGDYLPKMENLLLHHNITCFNIALTNSQLLTAEMYLQSIKDTSDEYIDEALKSSIVQYFLAGVIFTDESFQYIIDLKNVKGLSLFSAAELEIYFGFKAPENHVLPDPTSQRALPATRTDTTPTPDFRKLFEKGQLFENVTLVDNKAILNLNPKYNILNYPMLIYRMLQNVRGFSNTLSSLGKIKITKGVLSILLIDNHSFENGNDVLKVLAQCAAPKQLQLKKALAKGELLEKVALYGNIVKLYPGADYMAVKPNNMLNTFYFLWNGKYSSDAFKEKFYSPKRYQSALILKLRDNHGFKDADEVLAFLQTCAASKKNQSDAVESVSPQADLTNEIQPIVAEHTPPRTYLSSYELLFNKPKVSSYSLLFDKNNENLKARKGV